MKRLWSALLAAVLCLAAVFSLAACGGESGETNPAETNPGETNPAETDPAGTNPGETVNHTFATEWTTDEVYHWHACTDDGCDEQADFGTHTMEDVDGGIRCSVCGYFLPVAEHEHAFAEAYVHDAEYHWHVCTGDENCNVISGRAPHAFGNPEVTQTATTITRAYTCVDCGYTRAETVDIRSVVTGETEWAAAFSNLDFVNYSMHVAFVNEGETYGNECYITEDSALVKYGVYEDGFVEETNYFMKQEDGSYRNYAIIYDIPGLSDDTTDLPYRDIVTKSLLGVDFTENFASFVYDEETGSYRCADRITAQAFNLDEQGERQLSVTLYCYNIVITMVDGKIDSIRSEYDLNREDDTTRYSFEYFNIGTTVVVLPEWVEKNALSEEEAEEAWEEAHKNDSEHRVSFDVKPVEAETREPEEAVSEQEARKIPVAEEN